MPKIIVFPEEIVIFLLLTADNALEWTMEIVDNRLEATAQKSKQHFKELPFG
jgi:hypothetical protein